MTRISCDEDGTCWYCNRHWPTMCRAALDAKGDMDCDEHWINWREKYTALRAERDELRELLRLTYWYDEQEWRNAGAPDLKAWATRLVVSALDGETK